MKRFFLFFSLVCIAIGCTVDEQPVTPVQEDEIHPLDKAYVYEAFESKDFWKTLSSFEEKLDACQVPVSTAASLTTTALIQTCLNHPLSGLYLAYEDEFDIVQILSSHNNAFKELLIRDDAAEKMVALYASNPSLSLSQMHFFELLLGSGLFPALFEEPLSSQLKVAAACQLAYRRLMPDRYSIHSRKTAELLVCELEKPEAPTIASAGNQLKSLAHVTIPMKTKAGGDILSTSYEHTPFGSPVLCYYCEELTSSEIAANDAFYQTTYPNATLIEHSSAEYNCHSYAWNMEFGGETCCIPSPSPYIYDQSFADVNSSSLADIIYSPSSGFSGVLTSTTGVVVSKWSNGPVMQHALNDSPFGTITDYTYYKYDPYGAYSFWPGYLTGDELVYVDSNATYSYTYSYSYPVAPWGSIVWDVFDIHDAPANCTITYSDSYHAFIVFHEVGEFIVQCSYVVNNFSIVQESLNVYAEPFDIGNSDPDPDEPEME